MRNIHFNWDTKKYSFSEDRPTFIVAEAGVNHNGNLKLAKQLIKVAKYAGADAVKFQTFSAEEIAIPNVKKAKYHIKHTSKSLSWFQILKSQELSLSDHKILITYCKKLKIIFCSTPYDFKSVDLLESINVPFYKVSSTDLTNVPLISYIAKTGKPVIISTGMSDIKEISDAVKACRLIKNNKIVLLQCTANYPSELKNANLNVLDTYKKLFNTLVGYSDQTVGNTAAIVAVSKNAVYIEKHFTLNRKLPGPDHPMSVEPGELKLYISKIREAEKVLGYPDKKITSEEKNNKLKLQKSIVTLNNITKGEKISLKDISIKRPGTGIPPKYYYKIVSKKAKTNIHKNTPIKFNQLT